MDGYPPSAADFTVNDDILQGLKTTLAEKITTCRESLNSSGTVSRKTSTASDYTPEHTVSRDSRPQFIDQTNVSFSTESCMSVSEQISKHPPKTDTTVDDTDALRNELNDSLKQKDVKLVPGGKVDLKVFILQQQEPEKPSSPVVETETTETNIDKTQSESQLKVPQRKISRFLVSPVLSGKLDVPKEKETNEAIEAVEAPPPEAKVEVTRKNSLPAATEPVKPIEHEKTPETPDATVVTTTTEAPVLGPEMINTLEQLKISLDNLKNSSHPVTHKKEASDDVKKSSSAADVTTTTVTPKVTVVTSQQPIIIPQQPVTSTIYQNVAITMQPVPIIQPTTTTIPQTVPIVQPTQAYQQPVASVPPLLTAVVPPQPVVNAATQPSKVLQPQMVMQYVAPVVQPPQQASSVVTTSVPSQPVVAATVVKTEEMVVNKAPETKKVLENLRHVAER